jgi:putative OPT family oligopeptide transporter
MWYFFIELDSLGFNLLFFIFTKNIDKGNLNKMLSPTPTQNIQREITVRVVILSFFLTLLLAASNCFLALKIGYLTSASIPAAILSMGILRCFKNANILENNLVQTSASAGEAIAGGIAYTAPALLIIHYWLNFDYSKTFLLALTSGVLGVLFSTPLRRFLVQEKNLTFPEGRAIAEVLKAGSKQSTGLKEILWGSGVGALLELAQSGFQIIGSSLQYWRFVGSSLFGFGIGFSATMVGAGYLMGFQIALSLLVGAIVGFGFGIPLLTHFYPVTSLNMDATSFAMQLWQDKIRYIGIGAMLFAGLWTLTGLFRPIFRNIRFLFKRYFQKEYSNRFQKPSTETDLPGYFIAVGIFIMLTLLFFLLHDTINLNALGITHAWQTPFLLITLLYLLIIGVIFAAICGYFSGLLGVSATPGSAIVISGFLLTALILRSLNAFSAITTIPYLSEAAAMTILIGSIITGIAAIANDNIQDLKTGHLLGATPWKQEVMLLFGTLISAAVIPFVMQLLFNVYGIGDILPRPGMSQAHALAAPPAMMIASVAKSVFQHNIPWGFMLIGMGVVLIFIIINHYFIPQRYTLSPLGIATGLYLPITTTTPLFVGGLCAFIVKHSLKKHPPANTDQNTQEARLQRPILIACGLVSGAALMNVFMAIPFALTQNLDVLRLIPKSFPMFIPNLLGFLSLIGLGIWFYQVISEPHKRRR